VEQPRWEVVPRLRRVLAPALAVLVTAGVVAAPSGSAAPGAGVEAAPARVFSLDAGGGFDRLEVHLAQRRTSVTSATSGSGAVSGTGWTACVFGWTSRAFFSDCAAPERLEAAVAEGSADGRLRFTLRDDFWGDTAVVDLVLTDAGSTPALAWSGTPHASGLRVYGGPTATLTREATARGSVVLTTGRGKSRIVRRHEVRPGTPAAVSEAVSAAVGAGAL
jgi:hypothetical protein